ncbi:MAG: septum formation inhibitor Maf, partial [Idiomarina sp.]|nr:septum formation inhibitor Maf [Idiomarina sp.]
GSYFAVVGLPLYETEQLLRMFEMTGEVDER